MGENTYFPSSVPTGIPTSMPTVVPTSIPTYYPTSHPTLEPTVEPTSVPTTIPTSVPSLYIYNNNDDYNNNNNSDISLSLTVILAILSFIIAHNVYKMNKVKIQKCLNSSIKVKPIERSDYTGVIPIDISNNSIQ